MSQLKGFENAMDCLGNVLNTGIFHNESTTTISLTNLELCLIAV